MGWKFGRKYVMVNEDHIRDDMCDEYWDFLNTRCRNSDGKIEICVGVLDDNGNVYGFSSSGVSTIESFQVINSGGTFGAWFYADESRHFEIVSDGALTGHSLVTMDEALDMVFDCMYHTPINFDFTGDAEKSKEKFRDSFYECQRNKEILAEIAALKEKIKQLESTLK